jgi:hypothetical protein
MVATYGLRPHEVWHIDGLPDGNALITVGVAARHIKVTKTGFRAAVALPAAWVERYELGGANGEQRLAELRRRYKPRYVNEDGQPFDPERDQVKRCAWVETAPAQGKKKAQRRKERCVPYDLRYADAIRARETTSWSYADVAAVFRRLLGEEQAA